MSMKTAVFSLAIVLFGNIALTQTQDLVFTSVTPCVAFDTRPAFGGPGKFAPEQERAFHIVGSTANFAAQGGNPGGCSVPGFAGEEPVVQAVFINYVAVDPEGGGTVKAWPGDESEPAQGAMVNFQALTPPMNNSNGVVTGVRQDEQGNDIRVKAKTSAVHVRGVILGYFTKDHKHSGEDITTGTVAEARIDSAIARDSEILPVVLANDGTDSNIDADRLDGLDSSAFAASAHNHDSAYEKKYAHTIIVRSTGTPSENGAALLAAMASITGNSPSNTFLLKLEPGIYSLGDTALNMKPYVDIEGSGETVTTVTGTGHPFVDQGTINGSDHAEVRFFTVENTGGSSITTAMRNTDVSPTLNHMTFLVSGGIDVVRGVFNSGGSPVMRDVTVNVNFTGTGVGVANQNSNATLINVNVTVINGTESIALMNLGGTSRVRGGSFQGSAAAGGLSAAISSFDDSIVDLMNATLSASSGHTCYGIRHFGGNAFLNNVVISSSGCSTFNYGIANFNAGGSYEVEIEFSKIVAAIPVDNRSEYTTKISHSKLSGNPVENQGTLICAAVVDETPTMFAGPACP